MQKIEIACNSIGSCIQALNGGADRIELFENLSDGGCTPSYGTIKASLTLGLPIYVMIRPRGGNFCYNTIETDIMLHDIEACKNIGVHGIVFGCLNAHGEVDIDLNKRLLNAWAGPATFHRAIDRCKDIKSASHKVLDLGFERILSSGGANDVLKGLNQLKSMQEDIGKHIVIMPGAGVTSQNAAHILSITGCNEIHATCKSSSHFMDPNFNPEFKDVETISNEIEVKALVKAVREL
ncbi:MAG TPA: copper homeostasis protein CutC [Bacteroidia bacterium]